MSSFSQCNHHHPPRMAGGPLPSSSVCFCTSQFIRKNFPARYSLVMATTTRDWVTPHSTVSATKLSDSMASHMAAHQAECGWYWLHQSLHGCADVCCKRSVEIKRESAPSSPCPPSAAVYFPFLKHSAIPKNDNIWAVPLDYCSECWQGTRYRMYSICLVTKSATLGRNSVTRVSRRPRAMLHTIATSMCFSFCTSLRTPF